jgi:hypothetical protein
MRITAFVLAMILIGGLVWFANAMNGNPISAMLARKTATAYLAERFSHTDYYIEGIGYNFKDGNYYAHIRSDSSIDTQFSLHITMLGKLHYDTYDSVLDGFVTANRLVMEYGTLADTVLEADDYPYKAEKGWGFGTLEIYPPEAFVHAEENEVPSYAVDQSTLILDYEYDIRELGRQAGHIIIYVDSDTVTMERAAEIMLDIKARFDAAGIPFKAMDFVLQYPRPDEGMRSDGEVRVRNFPYESIYEEDLTERIVTADAELSAYYAEMDAKYK